MKKCLLMGAAAALALGFTACQSDDLSLNPGGDSTMTFTVSLPVNPNTRASASELPGQGNQAKNLYFAIYNHRTSATDAWELIRTNDPDCTDDSKKVNEVLNFTQNAAGVYSAKLSLNLVAGKTYDFVFWAAADDGTDKPYDFNSADQTVTVNYDYVNNNDEDLDAFYKGEAITVTEGMSKTIELTRPFAQLNIGTDDLAEAAAAGVNTDSNTLQTYVEVPVYDQFNLFDGSLVGTTPQAKQFKVQTIDKIAPKDLSSITEYKFPVDHATAGKKYDYISLSYLLVDARALVDVDFFVSDGSTSLTRRYNQVPVQRNYRTNIYGSLLTTTALFNVEINPTFTDPDNNLSSGELVANAEGVYEISSITQMLQLPELIAEKAHAEGNKLKLALVNDINMEGFDWTPLNLWWVSFDGQGHTISNLKCGMSSVGKSGFAAYMGGGEIKNLTLKNVTATGAQAGIISGQTEGATVDNVTITGVNTVNYAPNTGTYQETWCGVGALYGMCNTKVNGSGVTIAQDAVVNVNLNGMTTSAPAHDVYTYYTSTDNANNNPVPVDNKGTVTIQ